MKICIYILLFILLSLNISVASDIDIFNSINNKDSSLYLEMRTNKEQNAAVEGDDIVFYMAASKDCNIILIRITTAGEWIVLFPNKSHPDFQALGGSRYEIPGFNMGKIIITPPGGTEKIKAIAATCDDLFNDLLDISGKEDFTRIKSPGNFLKKLQDKLSYLPKEEWGTADLSVSVESFSSGPTVTSTPYINPEIENLTKHNYADEYYMQGVSYYEQKKYDKSIEQFKKVIKVSPNMAYAYYSLGLAYQAKGAFKESIQYYKKCLNNGIKERDCYIRVGEIYDQLGDKKEAYLRYKLALHITEGYRNIKDISPEDKGKQKIYDLEMLCSKNPADKDSRVELAVIYEKLDKFKAGCYHLKMLLKQSIPLYEPYALTKDKPSIEKPLPPEPPSVYYIETYTYSAPYIKPYIPPPPPPAKESPPGFIFKED
ncbi:MAG TPA: tetratricopeptide repeat protein [Candidatus Eremiobacteraeota bacterium]|nr:MAG: Photosystem I assembly protein Ycf3 [bacterium ADurb.Bin363]HPZ07562.1 tetratricopeptide repeat protein [Candidatus Eremiobacteraeota bacterium]